MNIIARKTQKLKTAKSENNEHYYLHKTANSI